MEAVSQLDVCVSRRWSATSSPGLPVGLSPGGVSSFWCLSLRAFVCFPALRSSGRMAGCWFAERGWVISIARLRTLPPVYLRPIDVIVFDGPYVEILS